MTDWDTPAPASALPAFEGPAPGFGEIFDAARLNFGASSLTNAQENYRAHFGRQIIAALAAKGVTRWRNPYSGRDEPWDASQFGPRFAGTRNYSPAQQQAFAAIARIRQQDRNFLTGLSNDAELDAAAIAERKRDFANSSNVLARGSGISAGLANMAGQMRESFADPGTFFGLGIATVATGGLAAAAPTLFGGSLASGSATEIAMRAATQGAINVATQAPLLPAQIDSRREIGVDTSAADIAMELGGAFVLGAGMELGMAALAKGSAAVDNALSVRRQAAALRRKAETAPLSGEEADALVVLDTMARDVGSTPFVPTLAGDMAHQTRLSESVAAMESDRAVDDTVFSGTPAPLRPPPRRPDLESFTPDQLLTDAARFQYKAGGDAAGVTDRLADVPEWSSVLSGKAVVWEQADGKLFIADGHQRLGLARRAVAAGQQDVRIDAIVLRESDGITPADARLYAALKNIAEGSGTALDTAKVLRQTGGETPLPLPPRSALMRDARGLAALAPDAFGMVVNGADVSRAALIGRLAGARPELHAQLLKLLERLDPPTLAQTEAIIRQAMTLPVVKETQLGLFGAETITRSLIVERAQLIDAVSRRMKNDKRAFRGAVDNADTLGQAGNVLATEANLARASQYEQAVALLQALANRPGPVADAITARALELAQGGNRGQIVKGLADDIAAIDLNTAIGDGAGTAAATDASAVSGGMDGGELAGGAGRAGRGAETGTGSASATGDAAAGTADGAPDGGLSGAPGFDPEAAAGDLFGETVNDAAGRTLLAGFADPTGPAVAEQVDSLLHDLKAELDPAAAERRAQEMALRAASPIRARTEQADMADTGLFGQVDAFAMPDGGTASKAGLLDEIDADDAALKAMRDCL